jgi:hypothetical protein
MSPFSIPSCFASSGSLNGGLLGIGLASTSGMRGNHAVASRVASSVESVEKLTSTTIESSLSGTDRTSSVTPAARIADAAALSKPGISDARTMTMRTILPGFVKYTRYTPRTFGERRTAESPSTRKNLGRASPEKTVNRNGRGGMNAVPITACSIDVCSRLISPSIRPADTKKPTSTESTLAAATTESHCEESGGVVTRAVCARQTAGNHGTKRTSDGSQSNPRPMRVDRRI